MKAGGIRFRCHFSASAEFDFRKRKRLSAKYSKGNHVHDCTALDQLRGVVRGLLDTPPISWT